MIHAELRAALETQIGHELRASHQYLAIGIAMHAQNLDGFAAFFERQSQEEREHALKIIGFLNEVGTPAKLGALEGVQTEFGSALEAVRSSLEYERAVTNSFQRMAGLALERGDHITHGFLGWFLNEQIEEEATFSKLQAILESGLNPFQAQSLLPKE
jgi:ferritin